MPGGTLEGESGAPGRLWSRPAPLGARRVLGTKRVHRQTTPVQPRPALPGAVTPLLAAKPHGCARALCKLRSTAGESAQHPLYVRGTLLFRNSVSTLLPRQVAPDPIS